MMVDLQENTDKKHIYVEKYTFKLVVETFRNVAVNVQLGPFYHLKLIQSRQLSFNVFNFRHTKNT